MRGWLVVLGLVVLAGDARAEAEHYEQVRVDAGMTGSTVAVSDRSGVGFVAEIKVNAHDNVAVGGRVEIAVMFGGRVDDEELPFGMAACGLLKGEYLLGTGPVRPFAGLGAGVYSMGSHTIVSDPDGNSGISTTTGRYFGVAPEVGIDLGRVRLAATYNAIIGTSVEYRQTSGGVEQRETFSQSYLSLELSFRFGGGRKPAAR
jgi:outer membrane protein X